MSYSITISEIANSDIADATEYYEVSKQGLGRIFLLSLKDTFKMLAKNPFMYVHIYKQIRRALIKKFPYAVFYQIDEKEKEVTIYFVMSTYRDPDLWKKRIDNIL